MYETIKYEVRENIAYISFNRPKALNAINSKLLDEMHSAFTKADTDETVRVVILTGEGKAFAAGADLVEMSELTAIEGYKLAQKGHGLMNLMESIEKPIIAAVNGFALGGGCEFSMACDMRIASEKAKFGQPEVKYGITPGFGGSQRLPRLVGKGMASYLIMTGRMIDAAEAQRIGLVEQITAPDELLSVCEGIAKDIIAMGPIAIASSKKIINQGYSLDMNSASLLEIEAFGLTFATEDKKEGMQAFVEKRDPSFKNK